MGNSNYRYTRIKRMIKFMRSDGLRQNYSVSERAYWADDWFTVEEIDNHTFIISEPRFHLQNNSYLLIGDTSALLFDTGSGKRDISPVVYSLTNLPLIVLPSHSHSDHLGSIAKFDRVVLADLPINRKNAQDNIFKPSFIMYCNSPPMPKIPVYKWLHPNEMIDLGNRLLRIIPTPGHSTDSITLLDEQHKLLFTGDFLYAGNLIATLGGSVTDYLKSTQTLITVTKGDEFIFPAHYTTGPKRQNLLDLEEALIEIIAGNVEGKRYFIAKKYPVNNKISFMTTPLKLRNAQSNHGS